MIIHTLFGSDIDSEVHVSVTRARTEEQNEALGRCLVPRKYSGPALIFVSFFISASTEQVKIPLGEGREDEKTVNLLYFMRNEVIYRASSQ